MPKMYEEELEAWRQIALDILKVTPSFRRMVNKVEELASILNAQVIAAMEPTLLDDLVEQEKAAVQEVEDETA